jgi:8-hydroxy-5-deazaflavin:NADPH oxidoreductase
VAETAAAALAIAGDDLAGKPAVTAFLDAIGYDAHDAGPLSESVALRGCATDYGYSSDGSAENPRPAGAARHASLLGQAKRYRDK